MSSSIDSAAPPAQDEAAPDENPLATLRSDASRQAKAAGAFDRAASDLAKRAARLEASPRETLDAIVKAREALAALAPIADPEPLLASLESRARQAIERASHRFGTALATSLRTHLEAHAASAEPGARPAVPAFDLKALDNGFEYGPFRIVPVPGSGRVKIEFARVEVLKNLAADPDTVAVAVTRFLGDLDRPPFDAEVFLAQMASAYADACRALGKQSGDPVDILEFWRRLVLEVQPDAFRRDPTGRRFREYPVWRLAHDLTRLRAARRFEVNGRRIELQTAVHDRAYGKSLWIPGEKGGGAYYQSIGFR